MARATSSETDNNRRLEILQLAGEIFADRGIANTTVRDIGAKVGILSGSLYYHFRSKDDMVLELLDRELRDMTQRMNAAIKGREPLDALRASIRAAVQHAFDKPTVVRILRNNVSCFAREVTMGGNELTQAIIRRLGIEAAAAEVDAGAGAALRNQRNNAREAQHYGQSNEEPLPAKPVNLDISEKFLYSACCSHRICDDGNFLQSASFKV